MIPGMFQNQKKNQKNRDLWQDINSHSINHDIKRAWTCCLLLTELLAFIIKCPHTSLISDDYQNVPQYWNHLLFLKNIASNGLSLKLIKIGVLLVVDYHFLLIMIHRIIKYIISTMFQYIISYTKLVRLHILVKILIQYPHHSFEFL